MNAEIPCLICGDEKAKHHYGSRCCSSCKAFFRRTVRNKKQYTCEFDGKCYLGLEGRNFCRACRFKKCLEMKMNPSMIQCDRGKYGKAPQDPNSPSTTILYLNDFSSNSNSSAVIVINTNKNMINRCKKWPQMGLNMKFDSIPNNCPLSSLRIIPLFNRADAYSVSQYFVAVEKLCDNFVDSHANHMSSSSNEYQCSTALSVEKAYTNPRAVSYRTPIDWKGRYHIDGRFMKRMWCRILTHYVDWLSHIPELRALSTRDQIKLMTDRATSCINLLCAYRAILTGTNGMVLSGGSYFPRQESEQKKMDKRVNLMQANLIYDEFTTPARHMHLTENEYAILRVLAYLMPVDHMSENGKRIVREATNFYRNVLCTQVRQSYPDLSFQQVMDRISRMMVFLSVFENAKATTNASFLMMLLFNCPDMKGNLTYEFHMRESSSHDF